MADDENEEALPRPRKAGGSNHSGGRQPNSAGQKKTRAPASKSPQRPNKPLAKTMRAKGPTRPPTGSNHGGRKPAINAAIPKGSGRGKPIPKGSGRAPPVPKGSNRGQSEGAPPSSKSRSSSDDELSSSESSDDDFDEEGLKSGAPVTASPSTTSGERNGASSSNRSNVSNLSSGTIRDRVRGATIRNKAGMRSDHSRGARSNNSGGSNDDGGAIIPFGESDQFESFHGNGQEQDYNGDGYNGVLVPVENNNDQDDDDGNYDQSQLRPPPKIKLAREDSNLGEFPNDRWWQSCLRHFRILSPHPQEDEFKKQLRYVIWTTLILDVLVAIVSIATFGDGVTTCCGTAVMAAGIPGIDWNLFMKVITWIYLIGIFLEIHPVVREGPIPWNLLNPSFGFLISFAVFVDDSKAEAISIWIMEMCSVVLELVTFRKLKMLHHRKVQRLEELEDDIKNEKYSHGYRKTAFLRERRETRLVVSESEKKLRYHFIGAAVNAALVSITLLLIIFVARGGGLCLVGTELDIFNADQQSRCNRCGGDDGSFSGRCIICKFEGTENEEPDQCYFPYF